MRAPNPALWKALEIKTRRHKPIICKTKHPLNNPPITANNIDEHIYVMADVPHVFRNIKFMIVSNKIIRISEYLQQKHYLNTNITSSKPITELILHQKRHSFQLTLKLSEQDLVSSHFYKIKVSTSTNIINYTIRSALRYLAEKLSKSKFLTTA